MSREENEQTYVINFMKLRFFGGQDHTFEKFFFLSWNYRYCGMYSVCSLKFYLKVLMFTRPTDNHNISMHIFGLKIIKDTLAQKVQSYIYKTMKIPKANSSECDSLLGLITGRQILSILVYENSLVNYKHDNGCIHQIIKLLGGVDIPLKARFLLLS